MTKIVFGTEALSIPTPKLIGRILKWIKRVSMAAAALSGINQHEYLMLTVMAIGWLADEIEPLFGEVQIQDHQI